LGIINQLIPAGYHLEKPTGKTKDRAALVAFTNAIKALHLRHTLRLAEQREQRAASGTMKGS
jgi:hypothetical protein